MRPLLLSRTPTCTVRAPVPACSILPSWLVMVTASMFKFLLLTAIRPVVLSRLPVTMVVSPVPVCKTAPLALSRFATCRSSWPACNVPSVLCRVVLVVTLSAPGVVMTALLVLTSPSVAVRPIFAALVWLPPISMLAPVKLAVPAPSNWPCAASLCMVLTVKSPAVPKLPSALIPAPIRLLAPLSRPFAVTLLLPCAAITPVFVTAPFAVSDWLPAAYRLPVLFRVSSVVFRFAPANILPAALFKFATFKVALPATACNWPLVLSMSPPVNAKLRPAATVPSVLSRLPTFNTASCAATMRPVLFSKELAFISASPLPSILPPVLSSWPVTATVISPLPVCARLPLRLSRLLALMVS
ncbi:hypothetical protein D3C87_966400 [compost metagenome]